MVSKHHLLIIIISVTGKLANQNTCVKFAFKWFVHTLALKSMISFFKDGSTSSKPKTLRLLFFNAEISKLGRYFHHFL